MKDLRECNKVLEYALQTSDEGIFYASEGIGDWDETVVCSINDASFGNEEVEVTPGVWEETEASKVSSSA